MAFVFNEEEALVEGGSNGKKVLDTGVYPITIETLSETTAQTGTKGFDISFKVDGAKYPNTVYGVWTEKADGSVIGIGHGIINNLIGLAGGTYTPYDKTIKVKDGKKVVKAVKEVDGFKGYAAIRKVYDAYNGEVREKNEIVSFFNEDGKTYAESKKNSDAKQIEYYRGNLKDNQTQAYKAALANGDLNSETNNSTKKEEPSSTQSLL